MSEVVKFEGANSAFMWVAVDRPFVRVTEAAADVDIELTVDAGEGARKATVALEQSLESVEGAAVALLGTVEALRGRDGKLGLDEVSLELDLSLGLEGGVIVAKGSVGAQASVTLTWRAR